MVVDITSLSLLIPLASGAIVSIISTIQNSKCSQISLCCGFVSCVRNVPDVEDTEELEITP